LIGQAALIYSACKVTLHRQIAHPADRRTSKPGATPGGRMRVSQVNILTIFCVAKMNHSEKAGAFNEKHEPASLGAHFHGHQLDGDHGEDHDIIVGDQNVLHRDLKGRHMQMIAMCVFQPCANAKRTLILIEYSSGGAIGAGLFVGSGSAFIAGGPASVFLGFLIVGIQVYVRSLSSHSNPTNMKPQLLHDARSRRNVRHVPNQWCIRHVHLPLCRPFVRFRLRLGIRHQLVDRPSVRDLCCRQYHPLLARFRGHHQRRLDRSFACRTRCHPILWCKRIWRGEYKQKS